MMPSDDLPLRFQDKLSLIQRWRCDGTHYKTANASLNNMDQHEMVITDILTVSYGVNHVVQWRNRWRTLSPLYLEL